MIQCALLIKLQEWICRQMQESAGFDINHYAMCGCALGLLKLLDIAIIHGALLTKLQD